MIKEVLGDVINAALDEEIDVIVQCCNCFNVQKKGFSIQMVDRFKTNEFPLEAEEYLGSVNKLGQIDYKIRVVDKTRHSLWVVNMYGQYHWSNPGPYGIPLDYDALRLCFRKLNNEFKKSIIGVPGVIGCGLAKGNPEIVKRIMREECKNCEIIIYYSKF